MTAAVWTMRAVLDRKQAKKPRGPEPAYPLWLYLAEIVFWTLAIVRGRFGWWTYMYIALVLFTAVQAAHVARWADYRATRNADLDPPPELPRQAWSPLVTLWTIQGGIWLVTDWWRAVIGLGIAAGCWWHARKAMR